ILAEEVDRVGIVRQNAAHLRRSEDNVTRLRLLEEGEHGVAILQVQFCGGATDKTGEALLLEQAPDGRADEAAVPGDVERRVAIKRGRREVVLLGRHYLVPQLVSFGASTHGVPSCLRA